MAAVDFVTGYITDYVDGMVRPYVEQGCATVGDVAGGIMFSAGDKISAAGQGIGNTINGYSTGVGSSISGVTKSIPGAPEPAIPSTSGSNAKPQKAIEGAKSASSTAPKSSDPRSIDRPPMPTTAEGRKKEIERLKTKGITRAKDSTAAKKSPPTGGATGGAVSKPQVTTGAVKKSLPPSGSVGGTTKAPAPDAAKAEENVPEEVRRSRRMAKKGKRSART